MKTIEQEDAESAEYVNFDPAFLLRALGVLLFNFSRAF
jgi:hypothetical protein